MKHRFYHQFSFFLLSCCTLLFSVSCTVDDNWAEEVSETYHSTRRSLVGLEEVRLESRSSIDTISLKKAGKWTIVEKPVWLDVVDIDSFMIVLSASENSMLAERSSILKVRYADAIDFDVRVTQHGHAVDLGLSVRWAYFNVGATEPEQYGNYYAWGEIEVDTAGYFWETYKWCNGTDEYVTKYCESDGKTTLDSSDDVARMRKEWGGRWRLPTQGEIKELLSECEWEWAQINGVNGYKVTGPNGNSIFLPAAGFKHGVELYYSGSSGYYWSSTLNEYESYYYASGIKFDGKDNECYDYFSRYFGRTVRPVYDGELSVSYGNGSGTQW